MGTRLRWPTLGVIAVVTLAVALSALWWWTSRGNSPPHVPFLLTGVLAAVAGLVMFLGLRVRRAVRTGSLDDPVGASRVLALAQAAAVTAAVHLGYFAAQAIVAAPRLFAPDPREQLVRVVVATVAALALLGAGLFAQWCCEVPDDDDEPPGRVSSR